MSFKHQHYGLHLAVNGCSRAGGSLLLTFKRRVGLSDIDLVNIKALPYPVYSGSESTYITALGYDNDQSSGVWIAGKYISSSSEKYWLYKSR